MNMNFQSPITALWFTDAQELTRNATAEFLRQFDIDVQFCVSPQELMNQPLRYPEVLLADWDLDGMDGRKAVTNLFESHRVARATPALLMTDRYVSQVQSRSLFKEGFRWVLRKPIVLSSLPKLIKRTVSTSLVSTALDFRIECPHTRIIQHSETASGAGYRAVCQ